jgi:antitoxin CptB
MRPSAESRIMSDARQIERLRWRCRRGLLELDLILARYCERWLPQLGPEHWRALDAVLMYPDNELLDFITGRKQCPQLELRPLIDQMRNV